MLLEGDDGVVNTLNTLGVAGMLYGYNGTTWDRLRVGTPADAYTTPPKALEAMSFLMGYDGSDWNMVRVDVLDLSRHLLFHVKIQKTINL